MRRFPRDPPAPAAPEPRSRPELAEPFERVELNRDLSALFAAYLDAALDCVVLADSSGRIVEFNAAAQQTFGYTRDQAVGRTLAELIVPPALRERHTTAFARFIETGEGRLLGRRLELSGMRADGSEFPVELALSRVEGEPLLICGALRDISEAKRSADDLRLLAEEQGGLRRVATLVATESTPAKIFAAVAEEAANLLQSPVISMIRYDADEKSATVIASLDEGNFPVGGIWPADGATIIGSVLRTGEPFRVDTYADVPGSVAERVRAAGIESAVGVPITVAGTTWGAMIAVARGRDPLPANTESRLARFTELVAAAISNAEARRDLRRLVDEQAALRRVATLVARQAAPADVFAAVAQEAGTLLGSDATNLTRYERDGTATIVGGWSPTGQSHYRTGARGPLTPRSVTARVFESGHPVRIDSDVDLPGPLTAGTQSLGFRTALAAPIIVRGRLWGVLAASATAANRPLPDAELRLAAFAELAGTAVANTEARSELSASRARILAAGDEARRRIERDLHDGTQQQLVSLGLELQRLRATLPSELQDSQAALDRIDEALDRVLDDVREISRGVHPAILSQWGLERALRVLARRSSTPVELDIKLGERLPESIEIAAYYVVSEALANVAKHAEASFASVSARESNRRLFVSVRDDGVGGADARSGSGLSGLVDRVEVMRGDLVLESPPGQGTTISIELPLLTDVVQEGDGKDATEVLIRSRVGSGE
jgi:PAS domain S-box-containing protein